MRRLKLVAEFLKRRVKGFCGEDESDGEDEYRILRGRETEKPREREHEKSGEDFNPEINAPHPRQAESPESVTKAVFKADHRFQYTASSRLR